MSLSSRALEWVLADRKHAIAVAVAVVVGVGAYGISAQRPMSQEAVCERRGELNAELVEASTSVGFNNDVFSAAGKLGSAAKRLSDDSASAAVVQSVEKAGEALSDLADRDELYSGELEAASAPIAQYCAGAVTAAGLGQDSFAEQPVTEEPFLEAPTTRSTEPDGTLWQTACGSARDQFDPQIQDILVTPDSVQSTCVFELPEGGIVNVTFEQVEAEDLQDRFEAVGLGDAEPEPVGPDMEPLAAPRGVSEQRSATDDGYGTVAITRNLGGGTEELIVASAPEEYQDRLIVAAVYVVIRLGGE